MLRPRRRATSLLALSSVLALSSILVVGQPAQAIVNGEPDGTRHPNVGVLFFQGRSAPGQPAPFAACSGVLISTDPAVFLTAAHCIDFFDNPIVVKFGVHFQPQYDPQDPPRLIPLTSWAKDPDFSPNSYLNDIGLVTLKKAPSGVTPAQLPAVGQLDAMLAAGTIDDRSFTGVGYGCQPTLTGRPACVYDGVRRVGSFPFRALTNQWLEVSSRSESGVCTGDSGGPWFIGSSNTVAALTSWGDDQCRATQFGIRLDTPSARDFLDDFVAVPA